MLAKLAIGLTALLWMTAAEAQQADPMKSDMWETIRAEHLDDGAVVFDDSIRLMMPERVETAFSVPMVAKFVGDLDDVEEFVVIVDNNPIQGVVRMTPYRSIESVGLDMRLERSTPVRAAARTADGVWHVASTFVTVMTQGGCSSPNPEVGESELGAIAAKTFDRIGGASRLKFRINHPMDTGFATQADGTPIPAYYIESMTIADESGPIADLHTSAAMASDPTIILDLPERRQSVRIDARDSEGLQFEFSSNPPTM